MSTLTERLTFANVMSIVAVFIALGGGAYALTTQDKKQVKKIAKKQAAKLDKKIELKPGPQGEQGPIGTPGEPGADGTAKGFGHWFGGTAVQDTANSENVEIAAAGPNGEYCINAVGFTPKNIQVTIDQAGQTLRTDRTIEAGLGGYGGCSSILPGTDAFVRTHFEDDDFQNAGFFILLN